MKNLEFNFQGFLHDENCFINFIYRIKTKNKMSNVFR